tara:strand:+ start:5679 stop:5804 length:126 start_codon:yes stop_codon:yes gene_type:complete
MNDSEMIFVVTMVLASIVVAVTAIFAYFKEKRENSKKPNNN